MDAGGGAVERRPCGKRAPKRVARKVNGDRSELSLAEEGGEQAIEAVVLQMECLDVQAESSSVQMECPSAQSKCPNVQMDCPNEKMGFPSVQMECPNVQMER